MPDNDEIRVKKRVEEIEKDVADVRITRLAFSGIQPIIDRKIGEQMTMFGAFEEQATELANAGQLLSSIAVAKKALSPKRKAHLLSGGEIDPVSWAEAEIEQEKAQEQKIAEAYPNRRSLYWKDHFLVCRSGVRYHDGHAYQGLLTQHSGVGPDTKWNARIICLDQWQGDWITPVPDVPFYTLEDGKAWIESNL